MRVCYLDRYMIYMTDIMSPSFFAIPCFVVCLCCEQLAGLSMCWTSESLGSNSRPKHEQRLPDDQSCSFDLCTSSTGDSGMDR